MKLDVENSYDRLSWLCLSKLIDRVYKSQAIIGSQQEVDIITSESFGLFIHVVSVIN